MKQTIIISKSVGKNATNLSKDVIVIQKRLNEWIAANKLQGLSPLTPDGQCGTKTKQAIGAFQIRFLQAKKPDCRADPGGQTVTVLGMDYSQGNQPAGDPVVYVEWLNNKVEEDLPYWQKRDMFWFGAGAKGGGGMGLGVDVAQAAMFNLKNVENYFVISALTSRTWNIGAGASGGAVLCFATGMYHPNEFNRIQTEGWDWGFSVGAKWLSFAKWVAKVPKLEKVVSAMTIAKYSNGDAISELAYIVKNGLGVFGLKADDPAPGFVTIDLPFGGGVEAAIYYGVTKYQITSCKLV